MPWSAEDADKHKSGLSDDQKKKWAKIANSVLEDDGDEAKAIRIANSQVGKSAEESSMEDVVKMWREDPTFRAMAMTYLGADEEVVKHLLGRHEQKDHDPTKQGGGHSRSEHTGGQRAAGAALGGLGAAGLAGLASAVGGIGSKGGAEPMWQQTGASGPFIPTGVKAGGAAALTGLLGYLAQRKKKADSKSDVDEGEGQFAPGMEPPPKNSTSYPEPSEAPKTSTAPREEDLTEQLQELLSRMKDERVGKSAPDFTAVGEFSKVDEDKQQVFGWASIVEKDGTPVVDLQGDFISPGDLEQAAYDYVLDSRVGGEMHQRVGKSAPKEVGTLIESMVITPEKVSKLGLPEGSLPTGWWVGYQVKDPDVWSKVKKGEYAGFSIHGYGKRKAVSKEEVGKSYDTREVLIAKALQFADTPESFAKNLWATAQALEDRDQRDEAMYFGRIAAGVFAASED